MRPLVRVSAAMLAAGLLFAGCHREEDPAPPTATTAAASRCMKGVEKAVAETTLEGLMGVYYEECSDLFSQAMCRDAWHAAAKAPLADQSRLVTDACRKAYCPMLGAFAFDICKSDFVSTPESITKSWPPLFDAIVAREAGAASNEVSTMLVAVYVRSLQLKPKAAAGGAAPTSASSASAEPPSAASAASAAPGSAAPPSSAAGAPASSGAAQGAAPPASAGPAGGAAPPKAKAGDEPAAAPPKAAAKAH